jgi:pimeloyl-ACP methyl ester carboxylesterase
MVVLDLPGHGQSQLHEPFTFELAAEAVERVINDSGVERPVLVGHSMGGPVVFTALRRVGPERFSGLLALATSAYWVRPRLRVMMALAPYAMAPRSPVLVQKQRSELRDTPERAEHLAWSYTRRPAGRLLRETAAVLRRFDARGWSDLRLPPTTWVVAALDGVLSPDHQRASASHFEVEVVEVAAQHSLVVQDPATTLALLEGCGASLQ